MSDEELKTELERLRNENAALKKGSSTGIRMKVSEKGAVSIYGMGRFPVTLYKEQWLKLLGMSDDIRAFIAANEAQLKAKHFGLFASKVLESFDISFNRLITNNLPLSCLAANCKDQSLLTGQCLGA